MEGRRVEIYDGWFGVVVREGPCQSVVRVVEAEPSLVGMQLIFSNINLKPIEEKAMATVNELTAQYNEIAKSKGLKEIKKFKSKELAEKRLAAIRDGEDKKEEAGSGRLDRNVLVNKFKFKKTKNNVREKLLHKLLDNLNQMVSKKDLGGLVAGISGLKWSIDDRKISNLEIKEERKEGQLYYGLYQKRVHGE
jgi:hypothetical protein